MVWWVTMEWFSNVRLRQILREENTRANKLSKLDPFDPRGSSEILVEYLERPSTQLELEILVINSLDWKSPIISCLKKGASLSMNVESTKFRVKVERCTLIDEVLYKKSLFLLCLWCLGKNESEYVLREIHDGIYEQYLDGQSLVHKAFK